MKELSGLLPDTKSCSFDRRDFLSLLRDCIKDLHPQFMLPEPEAVRLSSKALFSAESAARYKARCKPDSVETFNGFFLFIQYTTLTIYHRPHRVTLGHQRNGFAIVTEDRKRARPIAQSGKNYVCLIQQTAGLSKSLLFQLEEPQTRLGRPTCDSSRSHDHLARLQTKAGETVDAPAYGADILRTEFGIPFRQCFVCRGIKDS